jgi:hypothetical protein
MVGALCDITEYEFPPLDQIRIIQRPCGRLTSHTPPPVSRPLFSLSYPFRLLAPPPHLFSLIRLPQTLPGEMLSNNHPRPPAVVTLIDNGNLELVSVMAVMASFTVRSTAPEPLSYAVKCPLHTPTRNAPRQRRLHVQEITLHQLASVHSTVVSLHRHGLR